MIKIELWPGGHEAAKRQLGEAHLWNDLTSDDRPKKGNYKFRIFTWTKVVEGRIGKVWREGEVKGFVRSGSPWALLCYALLNTLKGCRYLSKKMIEESLKGPSKEID